MHKYIFILVLLLFGYVYNRDLTESIDTGHEQICLIEEIYGNFTNEELSNLIMKRKKKGENVYD